MIPALYMWSINRKIDAYTVYGLIMSYHIKYENQYLYIIVIYDSLISGRQNPVCFLLRSLLSSSAAQRIPNRWTSVFCGIDFFFVPETRHHFKSVEISLGIFFAENQKKHHVHFLGGWKSCGNLPMVWLVVPDVSKGKWLSTRKSKSRHTVRWCTSWLMPKRIWNWRQLKVIHLYTMLLKKTSVQLVGTFLECEADCVSVFGMDGVRPVSCAVYGERVG